MKGKRGTRGAVSVFLVIILVPCILVTSVFVDLGRVHMSKSMADSAGDLALNTLLTSYDADLKDAYGLTASHQKIEDEYQAAAKGFLRTMSSQKMGKEELFLIHNYYQNTFSSDGIADLLKVTCETEAGSLISEVPGANLGSGALLKEQLVEFMKYRGPIEIATGIIEQLSKPGAGTQDMVEAEKNEDLVDNKQDFYDAEGELLDAAFKSYRALYQYYSAAKNNNMDQSKLEGFGARLEGYRDAYRQIHDLTVKNLLNTSKLTGAYARVTAALDQYDDDNDEKSNKVHTKKETEDGETTYYINQSRINSLLTALNEKLNAFETAKTNFVTAVTNAGCFDAWPGSGANDAYAIQWWVRMHGAVNYGSGSPTEKLKKAAQEMLTAYSRVKAMTACEVDGAVTNSDWQDTRKTLMDKVESLHGKYLKKPSTGSASSDNYLKAVDKLEQVSAANTGAVKAGGLTVTVDGSARSLPDAVKYIRESMIGMDEELEGYIEQLEVVINGRDGILMSKDKKVPSLNSLLDKVRDYETALLTWENTAAPKDTDMKKKDAAAIAEVRSGKGSDPKAPSGKEVAGKITTESIGELKTRLQNIKAQMETVRQQMVGMRYGDKRIGEIKDYDTFQKQTANKAPVGDRMKNGVLSGYCESTFQTMFSPQGSIQLAHRGETAYDPDLTPTKSTTPAFFRYMYERYGPPESVEEKVKSKRKQMDAATDKSEAVADAAKKRGYQGGGEDITGGHSKNGFSLGSSLGGIVSLASDLLAGKIDNLRDNLYGTTYVMNMFSYDTYEKEAFYQMYQKEHGKDGHGLTLSGCDAAYNNYRTGGRGKWDSEDVRDSYNKSLTNQRICKENNRAYLAEVEYILYGGTNEKNISAAYRDIFGIRLALNTISGFANFWSNSKDTTALAIETVAMAIQGLTAGIIPAPLTKGILIVALATMESANDLNRLAAGFPVELYKMESGDWWYALPSIDKKSAEEVDVGEEFGKLSPKDREDPGKGLHYSDYLTFFLYLGLQNQKTGTSMYQRIGDVIGANVGKQTGRDDYSMEKARLYFRLEGDLRVKPLMIALPIFKNNVSQNPMEKNQDWCTYHVKVVRGYS